MKLKLQLITFLTISGITGGLAAPLTPAEALSRVENERGKAVKGSAAPAFRGTINNASGEASIYLFTYSGEKGFMLLPADDAVAPLLGYSETNSFPLESIPANLQSWLSFYSEGIETAKKNGAARQITTRASEWARIEPLLKTTWDQGSPYNNKCPIIANRRTPTGCVATAMAQVMKYWEYPEHGTGSIAYSPEEVNQDLSINFSETTFDWENMQDTYKGNNYNSKSADAVATLMKACGYSVKMKYSLGESGAFAKDIPSALTTYFNYDKGLSRKERSDFQSADEWDKAVYDNLAAIGPVICSGQSTSGAHCFVCDGYDGNGLFHINWGWGGLSDGYFLLSELTPSAVGTGGHYGGYNLYQNIILGIMPPVGRLAMEDLYISNAAEDSGNVKGWGYTYRINHFSDIILTADMKISGGYISSPLYYTVYETDPDTKKNTAVMLEGTFETPLNDGEGKTSRSTHINLKNFNPAQLYTINVAYDLKGQRTAIGTLRLAASSGVESIEAGNELSLSYDASGITAYNAERLEVWNTHGVKVASLVGNGETLTVSGLPQGIYIAKAYDARGVAKTLKSVIK